MPWDIDTSMLIYSESDGRVKDTSLNLRARKEMREEKFLNLSLAIDSLTGASPSGAAPAGVVQTFTNPSGNAQYTIAPGAQALDSSFLDTRTAITASWEMPVSRLALLSVGASLSDEYDYTHAGINANIARDFNNRNTTLSFGLALANDTSFGLGSYVFSNDPEQAARVADRIEAGMVYVNLVLADSPELPFGGIKRSGTARELGLLAADEFVNKKLIRTAGRRVAHDQA